MCQLRHQDLRRDLDRTVCAADAEPVLEQGEGNIHGVEVSVAEATDVISEYYYNVCLPAGVDVVVVGCMYFHAYVSNHSGQSQFMHAGLWPHSQHSYTL